MEVIVPDDQLSLAIGKKGQNVRLASRLTRLEARRSQRVRGRGRGAARARLADGDSGRRRRRRPSCCTRTASSRRRSWPRRTRRRSATSTGSVPSAPSVILAAAREHVERKRVEEEAATPLLRSPPAAAEAARRGARRRCRRRRVRRRGGARVTSMRTCVGCGTSAPQMDLLRDGRGFGRLCTPIRVRRAAGRGAYLHRERDCWTAFVAPARAGAIAALHPEPRRPGAAGRRASPRRRRSPEGWPWPNASASSPRSGASPRRTSSPGLERLGIRGKRPTSTLTDEEMQRAEGRARPGATAGGLARHRARRRRARGHGARHRRRLRRHGEGADDRDAAQGERHPAARGA